MHSIRSILIAEISRGESLSESFRSHSAVGRDQILLAMLIVAAVAAGMWAASRLLGMRRRPHGYHDASRLFRELCKAHHLTWTDRWLLSRVARHHALRDPARIFLEAELWEEKSLGPDFALEFARLRELQARLLAQPVRPATPAPVVARPIGPSPLMPSRTAPKLDVPPWTRSTEK